MQQLFDCPICLQTLLHPLTLTCGHSFCKPCLRNKNFYQNFNTCPVCRAQIQIYLNQFKVNVLLETIIQQQFQNQCDYQLRLKNYQHRLEKKNQMRRSYILIVQQYLKWISQNLQKMFPLIVIVIAILMYLRFKKLRQRFTMRVRLQHLSQEITRLLSQFSSRNADNYKDTDIQNLVFTKIVKHLFTNYVRF
ncbi:unnamed protein product [Paramecium octaurelia]|uniref:RING-type domain-containing protein n=1 Tax=Paramecium octaurelia TaxID=43137 RepID=A0A8S1YIG7_PAROT|nr:unnamed protein product [Paramecium octaurelia]